jgi:hypothetical protein
MAKKRAVQKGLEFSISINDLLPFPEICEVFGTKINYRAIVKKGGAVSDSPSIDRINTNLGYIKGNVKIISWRANRIKSDATVDELRKVVAYAAQQ